MPRDMRWKQLMHILGEINGAYHDASVKMGLADSEMQILYSVHMAEGKLYPSEIARLCGMSRQTVASAPAVPGEGGDFVSGNRRGPQPSRAPDAGGGGAVPRARGSGGRREEAIWNGWTEADRDAYLRLNRQYLEGPARTGGSAAWPAERRKSMKIRLSDHFTCRRLLRFTLPSIVMMIFTSIYGVVDGLFVSNFVGKTPLRRST